MKPKLSEGTQTALLFVVLAVTCIFAWRADNPEIIFSLASLSFGFYFGSHNRQPPADD